MTRRCAVVGGGASAALLALATSRRPRPVAVTIYEPRAELGRGFAYATSRDEHLLNVPAARLSAIDAEPDDFVEWIRADGRPAGGGDFLARSIYGRYLGARSTPAADHVRARVVDIVADGRWTVITDDGGHDHFDDVVLATGYGPAPGNRMFAAVESPLVVRDPYADGAFSAIAGAGDIVVLGTGLTAVDVILTLAADRPAQRILAVSRRGRLPAFHDLTVGPVDVTTTATTARGIVGELRAQVRAVEKAGGDWRAVVDGFRTRLPDVWRSLSVPERSRFLRHGRRTWDLHRHRLAPLVAGRLGQLVASGRVEIRRGTPVALEATMTGLSITLSPSAGNAPRRITAAGAVLCTGVIDDDWATADPLLGRLAGRGIIAADPLGIGPRVQRGGAMVGGAGTPTPGLWALGPLRRAAEWEATAIPEIRRQAAELAEVLAP